MSRNDDHVTIYQDTAGEWRWHRQAANGEVIAESGEGYANLQDARAIAAELNPGIRTEYEVE